MDSKQEDREELMMAKRIKTVNKEMLKKTLRTGGCGECPASCQSACKTSCGLANQQCENANR